MLVFDRRALPCMSLLVGCVVVAALALPPPLDYRYFATAARAWRAGASQLYDSAAPQFFYAPWALVVLVPLSFVPDRLGQALFNVITLVSLSWGSWVLVRPVPLRALTIALVTPYTASMLILGQWDGLVVGGVALAWWALHRSHPWVLGIALLLITIKPTNAILILVMVLVRIHRWPWQRWAQMLLLPLLTLAASVVACGHNWPVRYLEFLLNTPPWGYNVSLWSLQAGEGWPVIVTFSVLAGLFVTLARRGVGRDQFGLVLVVNLLVSPFMVPYHLVAATPAQATIARADLRAGFVLWFVGLAAFMAFIMGWSVIPLHVYLGLSMVAVAVMGRSQHCHAPEGA